MSLKRLIGKRATIIEYYDCDNTECEYCDHYDDCDKDPDNDDEREAFGKWSGIIIQAFYTSKKLEETTEAKEGILNVTLLVDDGEVYNWALTGTTEMQLHKDDIVRLRHELLSFSPEKENIIGREELLDFED